jgi:hypothetical protein
MGGHASGFAPQGNLALAQVHALIRLRGDTSSSYDPATPYRGAKNLVRDLGNARLLTMRGDGHTAYSTGNSACVSAAVDAYVNGGVLPAPGTQCTQDVGFPAPTAAAARSLGVPALGVMRPQLHVQSDAVIR